MGGCGFMAPSGTAGSNSASSATAEGDKGDAIAHLEKHLEYWMANSKSDAATITDFSAGPPVAYTIKSTVPDKAERIMLVGMGKLSDDWQTWPCYKINVAIEWPSAAGNPVTKIRTYLVGWHGGQKKWGIRVLY